VPPRAKIVASENIVPHVSNRPDAYTLRMGLFDADYLLFEAPRGGEEGTYVKDALAGQFGVVTWRRRGGEHADELVRARFGALATSGRAVE